MWIIPTISPTITVKPTNHTTIKRSCSNFPLPSPTKNTTTTSFPTFPPTIKKPHNACHIWLWNPSLSFTKVIHRQIPPLQPTNSPTINKQPTKHTTTNKICCFCLKNLPTNYTTTKHLPTKHTTIKFLRKPCPYWHHITFSSPWKTICRQIIPPQPTKHTTTKSKTPTKSPTTRRKNPFQPSCIKG